MTVARKATRFRVEFPTTPPTTLSTFMAWIPKYGRVLATHWSENGLHLVDVECNEAMRNITLRRSLCTYFEMKGVRVRICLRVLTEEMQTPKPKRPHNPNTPSAIAARQAAAVRATNAALKAYEAREAQIARINAINRNYRANMAAHAAMNAAREAGAPIDANFCALEDALNAVNTLNVRDNDNDIANVYAEITQLEAKFNALAVATRGDA